MAVHLVPTSEKVRAPWERSVRGCGTSVRGGCARVVTRTVTLGFEGSDVCGLSFLSEEWFSDDGYFVSGVVVYLVAG